jgi:hypothetical protein
MIEITFECGDTQTTQVRPTLGEIRGCLHCYKAKRVVSITEALNEPPKVKLLEPDHAEVGDLVLFNGSYDRILQGYIFRVHSTPRGVTYSIRTIDGLTYMRSLVYVALDGESVSNDHE